MYMSTHTLIATPCDEEEDNLASLCCHIYDDNVDVILARYPDDDEVVISFEDDDYSVEIVRVTLSPTLLRIEIADTGVFEEENFLEITHATDADNLADVEQTLQNILGGTGKYVSQLA